MKPILVLGATGRHGGTGASVARSLLAQGRAVRVMSRSGNAHFEGAQAVQADLHDRRTLQAALEGVEEAYFAYPIAPGITDAAANFASVGRSTGLKRVVVMSMGPSRVDSLSPLGRAQAVAEEILEWAGFQCLHLRVVALFFENLELLHGREIREDGVMRNSFADLPMNWMAGSDAAKLAVAALLHPERFEGKKAVWPTGGNRYSHAQVGELLAQNLGHPVSHKTISAAAWRDRLLELAKVDTRVNAGMASHISAVGASITGHFPANELFQQYTGEQPQSLEEAIRSGSLGL